MPRALAAASGGVSGRGRKALALTARKRSLHKCTLVRFRLHEPRDGGQGDGHYRPPDFGGLDPKLGRAATIDRQAPERPPGSVDRSPRSCGKPVTCKRDLPATGWVSWWGHRENRRAKLRSIRRFERLSLPTLASTLHDDAPVAEWVDATDLKSVGRKAMQVRLLPGAPAFRERAKGGP